jgi:hypothetical protein
MQDPTTIATNQNTISHITCHQDLTPHSTHPITTRNSENCEMLKSTPSSRFQSEGTQWSRQRKLRNAKIHSLISLSRRRDAVVPHLAFKAKGCGGPSSRSQGEGTLWSPISLSRRRDAVVPHLALKAKGCSGPSSRFQSEGT